MENNRGIRAIAIVALLIAVAGISIAFAALNQDLDIEGAGKVQASNWSIKWTQATGSKLVGGITVSPGTSNIGSGVTNLQISDIILKEPGDKIQWIIRASNLGDIDAKLENITSIFTKTITRDPSETSDLTENDIFVTLTKNPSGAIAVNDELLQGGNQDYLLTVEFNPNASEVPSHDLSISVTASFPWIQK